MYRFHPAVSAWFEQSFAGPTEAQRQAWPLIQSGRNTLIAAPTGSGKTLAAFLNAIDTLVRRSVEAELPDAVQVVYVSPLKALSNDIQRNLEQPLREIGRTLTERGFVDPKIRTQVRTGDTTAADRNAMLKQPPHLLVTTPESLYILLTSERGRQMLATAGSVIVDEIHAVADDKRGSHLALTLERLDTLVEQTQGRRLVRIGLSATQRPIERMARLLVGQTSASCAIVDTGHRRDLDLGLELPRSPLQAVMENEVWEELYDRMAQLIGEHRTTLIFVNTRRMAERVTRHLTDRIGEGFVSSHHGSLSRERRFAAEQQLKAGELRALVATASLELGIDVGAVDLVINVGSTRSIATLIQRVGRSGHTVDGTPKGRLFPTSRDELVECVALLDAMRRDELESLVIPQNALDVLAQQIVASVACEEWAVGDLFEMVRRAQPYNTLQREAFDAVVTMLAEGFATRRGRRGALLHHDRVHGKLRPRRGARLAAITSGGAIPDNADFRVVLQPSGTFVGTVDEDFAVESMPGDIFQLGNSAWKIQRVEQGRVLVEDATGQPPTIPFWFGEAPARSDALSTAVSRLRAELQPRLKQSRDAATQWLCDTLGLELPAAQQASEYLATSLAALGVLPTQQNLVLERFFDDVGDQHLVIHAPLGSRLNRAFGLALRKRFCRQFNFELQAAATDDAILLSLGPTHSFKADDVFRFLNSKTVRNVLTQAALDAPIFDVRWRWNAGRALALLRWQGGRRVPPQLQRMQAEDLIAVVFPDQLACLENIVGEREIPDHPLIQETVRDCLEEAMDIDRLEHLLQGIESGGVRGHARELREPSPLAHEILSAKPYAFLDEAPLEERRSQAVRLRRWIDPESAADLGALDAEAIRQVRDEAWPSPRDADELHDALASLGCLTEAEASPLNDWLCGLETDGRAGLWQLPDGSAVWIAAESADLWAAAHPDVHQPRRWTSFACDKDPWTAESAATELVRRRLHGVGPTSVDALAASLGLERTAIEVALAQLETEGFVMQGTFTPNTTQVEWCERGLLARIHRRTLKRLRREIEPVAPQDYMRFLFAWQGVDPKSTALGPQSLQRVLEQLEGFEAPAVAWEGDILPARLARYDPRWLDGICLSGRLCWVRASVPSAPGGGSGPIRTTPITLVARSQRQAWADPRGALRHAALSTHGRAVAEYLRNNGASFFDELTQGTRLLPSQIETALGELVGCGLATSDSFIGLRALLAPSRKRSLRRGRWGGADVFGMENAGRWSYLEPPQSEALQTENDIESIARALLRRYGVVFRRLLEQESSLPPWRDLLYVYRRLEARGELRGGRFVDGFSGEQFALPEAVTRLRQARRRVDAPSSVVISAADPLNLTGVVVDSKGIPAVAAHRILFRDGIPVALYQAGKVEYRAEMTEAQQWQVRQQLVQRNVPPALRAYIGRPHGASAS